MTRNIAVIPARGGSKRLPRKNILPFRGKPMVLWTCEAARDSGCFDLIIVSTEDAEIASTVRGAGFVVEDRPQELATDKATCVEVCLDVLRRREEHGEYFGALCCLYATAPLRNADDIRAVMALLRPGVDAAFAVCGYDHPPHQMLYENAEGFLAPAFPLLVHKKSQEVPEALIGNGSTYAITVAALKKWKTFYAPRILGYRMPAVRSIDVDTQEDFDFLNFCSQRMR